MFQKVIDDSGVELAIIIRSSYSNSGIHFFTPNSYSQQLGYMSRPSGYVIEPHTHNPVSREVLFTNEVLFIKSGSVRVDFFNIFKSYLFSYVVNRGDILLLSSGGHGFKMLADSEIIEVKQGPYAGENDKTRFASIDDDKVILRNG